MIEERDYLAAGDPVFVCGRLIIPIVHILRLYEGLSFAASLNPVAFLIIEGKSVFLAPNDADMDETRLKTFLAETFGITFTKENDR